MDLLDAKEEPLANNRIAATLNNIDPAGIQNQAETQVKGTPEYAVYLSNSIRVWQAKSGSDLQRMLKKWGEQENVEISWDAEKEYELDYDIFISGTFENAIDVLLSKGLRNGPDYVLESTPHYKLVIQDRH